MLAFSLFALPLVGTAHAAIYSGNPELWLKVDRPAHDYQEGAVFLHEVVVHTCSGGHTSYVVDGDIDPVAGWGTQIGGGDLCGITLAWGSDLTIEASSYTLTYGSDVTEVYIGSSIAPVSLTPFTVVYGQYTGAVPALYLTLN